MVLLVAVLLIAAAAGLMFVGRERAEPYVLVLLAILGMIGIFSLFATAAGILQVGGRDGASPMLRAVADGATDGILITDPGGRVIYANAAYRALTDAVGTDDARPIERVFLGDPEVSEAIYRLVKAAREGRRLQEEVRIVGPRGEPARWLRMRVRPLGEAGRDARTAVWSVADVTRDRDRHETAIVGLQHAIDYLDHAPAGFFSVDRNGHVGYLNATLADWLGHDLAQIGSAGLRLTDIVPGESASLLTQFNGEPGDVKIETLDLDLKTRTGKTLPVRLYHKVAFAADGTPGASRTLVLNRANDDGADAQRAAEVRFIRFFHNTPLAIATVDKTGRIVRTNALAARLVQGILKG
ncbi:MAG TPA: PAS domain-containing protein, partial [Caldimonas sp.]|nr:PAS domain-containing protein [Caldimonas sp.]